MLNAGFMQQNKCSFGFDIFEWVRVLVRHCSLFWLEKAIRMCRFFWWLLYSHLHTSSISFGPSVLYKWKEWDSFPAGLGYVQGLSHACHSSTRMQRGLISSEQVRPTVQASLAPDSPSHLTESQCRLHARRLSWRGAALLPVVSAGLQGAGSRGSTVTGPGQGFAAPGLWKALANLTHSSLHHTESFWGS